MAKKQSEPESVVVTEKKPRKFHVQLSAHTPVAFNSVVIDAETEGEARAKFCEMNGITDSTCPWTITEVKE